MSQDYASDETLQSLIITLVKESGLSAGDISRGTNLSERGIAKILKSETANPRRKNLLSILDYLEERLPGSAIPGHKNYIPGAENRVAAEPKTSYNTESSPIQPKNEIERLEDAIRMRDQVIELLTEQRDMLKARNGELSEKVALLEERLKKADKQHS